MAAFDRDWMINAKCRTTTDHHLYNADNRGRGKRKADQLEQACGGCPVIAECAAYALKYRQDAGGVVWAGVPVPQTPGTKFWNRAIADLESLAAGVTL